ncbi:exodeoxyribonuclease III [Candidatus Nucleicultrix amoebiphila]|jgi:exodeoxyribonuclease-3|uniref:Exodeoxyribonuclease III n=1 Tax=Candidatus Nucleicultrix amoebiphila FS5 TaxID=1414854 RepID=A0A1W6N4J4_9PROT|nr:exodeoxyribonuclease III [Candidatus Nucleicultrix amoebiphila]ARN84686.1 exodeoxyribonuclease III [Candidatus Nucleicultrix amoebiphila FS5]
MTKIATWNVNSIRVRLPQVLEWIKNVGPDILLLQEIKCLKEAFPSQEFEEAGYNVAVLGQKTYNGVAILAKNPIEDVKEGLPGDDADIAARYIEAVVGTTRVASVYVPNGREVGSESYEYKLRFYERLHDHLKMLLTYNEVLCVGGDYNVAPEVDDVYDPSLFERERILCSYQERAAFRKLVHLGLYDAQKQIGLKPHQDPRSHFTWWDYRAGSWQQNLGFRIDHFLLSPQAIDLLEDGGVAFEVRGQPQASDHAPLWIQLK